MCGEKAAAESAKRAEQGSPPHVRGKALHLFQRVSGKGITPAYAGKSSPFSAASRMARNHPPHMRG